MKILDGYKTYLAAFGAFLIALGAAINQFATGKTIEYQYVIDTLIALALLFLRQGIKKDQTS